MPYLSILIKWVILIIVLASSKFVNTLLSSDKWPNGETRLQYRCHDP